jgi:hypothetical protein
MKRYLGIHPMSYFPIIAGAIAIWGLWWGIKKWQRHKFRRRLSLSAGTPNSVPTIGKVAPKTRQKLLKLLGNNQATADRLIGHAKLRNPGEPEQWYWEKVLYDLERDRWR